MGWFGGHLHSFEIDGDIYQVPDGEDFGWRPMKDERKATVAKVLPRVGMKMRWDYDFGDGSQHDITVEAVEPATADAVYPRCLTGRRACPPEDCGGPWGNRNLLDALADPNHPEHQTMTEWAPPGFNPARFDPAETTDAIRHAEPWTLD